MGCRHDGELGERITDAEVRRRRYIDRELIRMDRESAMQGAYEDGYKEGLEEVRRECVGYDLE